MWNQCVGVHEGQQASNIKGVCNLLIRYMIQKDISFYNLKTFFL